MWMIGNSWANSLLSRFLPAASTTDETPEIIRYDPDEKFPSLSSEWREKYEDVIRNGSPVDYFPDREDNLVNSVNPGGHFRRQSVPLTDEQTPSLKASHCRTTNSPRPTSLSPPTRRQHSSSLHQPLKFNQLPVNSNSTNRLPKKRQRSPEDKSTPIAELYDHNQNVLNLQNSAERISVKLVNTSQEKNISRTCPVSQVELPYFQESVSNQCKLEETKPIYCNQQSYPKKGIFRNGNPVKEPRRRRNSTDEGFGFLTPDKQTEILRTRQSWESGSKSLHNAKNNHSIYIDGTCQGCVDIAAKYCGLKKSHSHNNVDVNSTKQNVEEGRRKFTSSTVRPLVLKFQDDLEPKKNQTGGTKAKSTDTPYNQNSLMMDQTDEIVSKNMERVKLSDETISYINQNGDELSKDASLKDRRERYERETEKYGYPNDFDGIVKHFVAPSIKYKDGIPVDIIKPNKMPQVPTILIYFHGGDLTTGSKQSSDTLCKYLATQSKCIVVNAEYRLAPEYKFPAQLDDANCVVRWVKMNRGLLGAVLESKIGIAGESFGGLIAASVCPQVMSLDFQLLISPVLDLSMSQPSVKEFEKGPGISKAHVERIIEQTFADPSIRNQPKASPLKYSNFKKFPRTFLLIAEADPFRDAAYEFKQKLEEAEVPVISYLAKGAIHSFFRLPGHFKNLCEESSKEIVEFLEGIAWKQSSSIPYLAANSLFYKEMYH